MVTKHMEHDVYKTSSSNPIRSRVIGGLSGYLYAEISHHFVTGCGIVTCGPAERLLELSMHPTCAAGAARER